jgi:hypothetical protein
MIYEKLTEVGFAALNSSSAAVGTLDILKTTAGASMKFNSAKTFKSTV